VARQEGVRVYERFSKRRGKGFALEWMFNELYKMEEQKYCLTPIMLFLPISCWK